MLVQLCVRLSGQGSLEPVFMTAVIGWRSSWGDKLKMCWEEGTLQALVSATLQAAPARSPLHSASLSHTCMITCPLPHPG